MAERYWALVGRRRLPRYAVSEYDAQSLRERIREQWPSLEENPAFEPIRSRLSDEVCLGDIWDAIGHVRLVREKIARIRHRALPTLATISLVGMLSIAYGLHTWLLRPDLDTTGLIVVVAGVVGMHVAAVGAVQLGRLLGRTLLTLALVLSSTMLVSVGSLSVDTPSDLLPFTGAVGGILTTFYLVFALVATVLMQRLYIIVDNNSKNADPAAHVLVALANVVDSLCERRLTREALRASTQNLEEAAVVIWHNILEGTDDPTYGHWLKAERQRRAEGIRRLKRTLYLPGSGDAEAVATECGKLAVAALDRHWADFPAIDPVPVATRRRRMIMQLLRTVRSLVVATVPLTTVAVVDYTTDSFNGAAATWAWAASCGWTVVTLLTLADPQLGDKIEYMKGLQALWHSGATPGPSEDNTGGP